MAVTTEQVNQLYGQLLGRQGQDQYLQGWANSGMTLDEIRAGIANSPEGVAYAQSQSTQTASSGGGGGGTTAGGGGGGQTAGGTTTSGEADPVPDSVYTPPVTIGDVNSLYNQYLGRDGNPQYLQQWVDSGYDLDRLAFEIANSPEGIAYRENTSQDPGDPDPNDEGDDEVVPDDDENGVTGTENGGNNQSVLDAIRAQQAAYEAQQQALMDQLAAQQQAQQDMFSQYGQSAKGGTGQQGPMFSNENAGGGGGTGIQPPPNPYGQNPYSGGYGPSPLSVAQNPYSSGYGMANQYMPQTGLLGPSGFGGYGGYSPYGGGKGGGYAPVRPMMGKGRPYSTGVMTNDGVVPTVASGPLPSAGGEADPVADTAYGIEGAGPSGPPPQANAPIPTPVGDVFPRQATRFPSYGGKGGYGQPMYRRPMYQPMGGYYGGGYYR